MTPRLPPSGRRPDASRRNAATCLAMVGLMGISGGLMFVASLVLPQFISLAFIVLLSIGMFFAIHYVTWGRWLMRARREEQEIEDDAWVD